ncbi:metallophosphoesterase [Bradyrhizobium sp. STM 3809]|uniref:metallophosphoesterase n=1 Tax=Bradyrhizobium sp. STM 3809 TaxID=551936 RepID=UPI001478CD40|nr:metallophosphoesterase [Bradyrhizobium sp. STM 3809]
MRASHVTWVASCLLAWLVGGGAAECAANKPGWSPSPAIVQLDTSEEIFAVGDPHGDPSRLATVLAAAGLIEAMSLAGCSQPLKTPPAVSWTGARKILVITGDLIDKGCDSVGVIMLLRALQRDAAAKGGRVIVTLGNHEAEFLDDPDDPKTEKFGGELQGLKLKPEDVAHCRDSLGLGEFLCALPIAVRVNEWLFSHGGNSGGRSIAQIGKLGLHDLAADPNSILQARLNKKGPNKYPWVYAGNCKTDPKQLLESNAAALSSDPKVRHFVLGHQYEEVQFYSPDTACKSKDDRKPDVTRDAGRLLSALRAAVPDRYRHEQRHR